MPDPATSTVARVLVVDDSAVVRRILGGQLHRAGWLVREAASGSEALAAFEQEPFEVVITDINMPGLDGLELLARLRQREVPPEVILLTGSRAGDALAAVQALRLGAYDYIAKDSEAGGEVVLAVQRAVEKWRLREENARLLRELSRLSLEDALTGLGNRRAFDGSIVHEVARAGRHGRNLSLAMLDLDHFKRVNDSLGHPAGDAVLASFAGVLRSLARQADLIYRYGGEEFAVILPDCDDVGALAFAQRVVHETEAQPLCAGRQQVAITCSVGVACLAPRDRPSGEELVVRADRALYEAKDSGRNRAVLGRDETPSPAAALEATC